MIEKLKRALIRYLYLLDDIEMADMNDIEVAKNELETLLKEVD